MSLKFFFQFLFILSFQAMWAQVSLNVNAFDLGAIRLSNQDLVELNIINKSGEVVHLLNFEAQPNISIKYSSKKIGIGEIAMLRFKLNPTQKGTLTEKILLHLSSNENPIELTFNAKVKKIAKNSNQECPDFSSNSWSKNRKTGRIETPKNGKMHYFFLELLPKEKALASKEEEIFNEVLDTIPEIVENVAEKRSPKKTFFQTLFGKETTKNDGSLLDENAIPNNIVFLIDASSSMEKEGRMDLLKATMIDLLTILREEDYLSIVIYSGNARTLLPPTSGIEKKAIKASIESIKADGSTQAAKGIEMALNTGQSAYIDGGLNQIILATDGDFDIGKYNTSLRTKIEKNAKNGLTLSTIGIKNERWTAASLKEISNLGSGIYFRVNSKNDVSLLSKDIRVKSSVN